jgi:hypothetical protein
MADQKNRKPSKPASEPEKKKPAETVNLTSEELRRISGGYNTPPNPPPKPNTPTSKP